jgi:ATP-binding cassette subfamily B protein
VLKGINFEIKRGEILGLTGPTGSGKTTLISLILRIWEPPSKTIFLDDYDITTIDLDLYRKNFAYVSQESFLFSASLRENLAFGKPSASDEEIIKFAKLACIWEDIEKLENGLDTTVGERGITLSGGQKQRVAIARALIAGNPILILDDPLSAVDSETEQKIIINIKEYLKEKDLICIIISHRIAALSWANKIGVIKKGKLTEYGTHSELLEKKCYYYHIYRQQYLEGLKALNNNAG